MIKVIERDFASFFDVPFHAYDAGSPYVSPLKSDLKRFVTSGTNPLFPDDAAFSYYTAFKDDRPLGRIVVHAHHKSNQLHGSNRASFGFFDCADDPDIAAALLSKAEHWARERGFDELVGNFNLTAMQQMGVQTDNFGKPGYTDMVVNPPHIPELLKQNGFEAFFPVTTFDLNLANAVIPRGQLSDEFRFAPIERRMFKARMEDARIVLNDGFAQNPMFVPQTTEEFTFQAGEMMSIMDTRLSSVVMQHGDPVGVVICIPDLNGFLKATRSRFSLMTPVHFLRYRLRRKRAVIIFYSVAQRCHGRGLMSAILARTLTQLRSAGYERLGVTWIADENTASLRMMDKIGAKPLHRLHLFRKDLTS
ncbi:GNAT family N-acetyltransferase [Yoonia sp. F2084L]|uniref:GNAT family N-acetyltransferase n=1 Tax=Yoonia sp. F2084L TaxID=2926419 RepID=UPI001FF4995C|nr:GNAT family N-acetyltransferase [Yoonia sp. F2084L]MCK0096212.1 GNAT family N-acetyltransferase [Yoonia sp. F2084L]